MTQYRQRLTELIALALILTFFCYRVASFHPSQFFGFFQDDTIYFGSARALAGGQGYVLPSFPGVLPQTKYPILYPLLLSLVWRISPVFPNNLALATVFSVAIAVAYLVLSYVFIRRSGASIVMGICVLVAIAFHPELQWFAGVLLSDYLFALLVLASALSADEAWLNSRRSLHWGIVAGLLLGLSMLTRSAAIGVIAGIALYGALQRRWRTLIAMLTASALVVAIGLAATHALSPATVAAGAGTPPATFGRVLAYDSSYARFWMLSVPNLSVLGAMLKMNGRLLLLAPGNYLVMLGVALPANLFSFALALLVSAASVGGIVRLYRSSARRSLTFAFVGSLPILLLWNYVLYDRFLLPFVPLIFLGVAIETRRMMTLLGGNIRQQNFGHRVFAAALAAVPIGLMGLGVYSYVRSGRGVQLASQAEASLNSQREEAYSWLSREASPADRVIAYADGLTYLFSGRQAVRALEITTDCVYGPHRKGCDIETDDVFASTRYVGARYWMMTPADFGLSGAELGPRLRQRLRAALESRFQRVFVSSDGTVVVYELAPKSE